MKKEASTKVSILDHVSRAQKWRPRRRLRLQVVNENSLTSVVSVHLSGGRLIFAVALAIIAMAAILWCILFFTPLRQHMPGQLEGNLRHRYEAAAMRLDSLSRLVAIDHEYARNLRAILCDSLPGSNVAVSEIDRPGFEADSLADATERERSFVRSFEETERYNVSVLSPIAAEGMIFESPSPDTAGASGAVAAVYRGTVISVTYDASGRATVTVQHPNDFISIYKPLYDTYVNKGSKVVAGQRIGRTTISAPLVFELWHGGSPLDPSVYVNYKNSTES